MNLTKRQDRQSRRAAGGRDPALRRRGFTLIELLLVMIILVVLASIAVPIYIGRAKAAKVDAAKSQISLIKSAINTFEADTGDFPPNLEALVTPPAGVTNAHEYLDKVPVDPWGNSYQYKCPGAHGHYDVWSTGPDGQDGTQDDVNSWDQ